MPLPNLSSLLIEGTVVEVEYKPVRRLRLSIRSPQGQLRVTVPPGTGEATIRELVLGKRAWIQRHQAALQQRPTAPVLRYETSETHYYQGRPWRLRVHEQPGQPHVRLAPDEVALYLTMPAGTSPEQRAQVLARWRFDQLQAQVRALLAKREPVVGARASDWGIRQMRTRWGTCSIRLRRIWLSLSLSEWPLSCLEYVLVHELTHLHEPSHNARFWHLVGQAMPEWRTLHQALKQGDPAAFVAPGFAGSTGHNKPLAMHSQIS